MNMFKDYRPLASLFLLLAIPAIASEEAPSTPPRKRLRPDNSCVTPPRNQRQRLMPSAFHERGQLSISEKGQRLVDKIQKSFDRDQWVRRYPSVAGILVTNFSGMSESDPSLFNLTASDGRSVPFMVSQHPQLSTSFAWLWAELPHYIKGKEVAFHESLDGLDGNTLLHNLIAAKNKPMVQSVLGLNQDLLRPNSEGQIPAFFAGDSLGEVSRLLKEKTYAQWERRVDSVDSVGMIPRPLSMLVISMISGDMGPGYRA